MSETIQPLTPTVGATFPTDAQITLTRVEIVGAFKRWEDEFRAGKCMPAERVLAMPVGEAAEESATAFLLHVAHVRMDAAQANNVGETTIIKPVTNGADDEL